MAMQRILTRRAIELWKPLHRSPEPSPNPLHTVIRCVSRRRPVVCSAVLQDLRPTVMSVGFVVIRRRGLFESTEVPID